MKLLYIWDGQKPLPEDRRAAVRATLDLYPDADCFCITRALSFHSERFNVIPWDSLMSEMREYFGFREIPYNWLNPITFSDWARFWVLGHSENTLYLDTDAKMEKAFPFGPRMAHSPGNICVMWSGSDGGKLIDMLMEQAKKNIGQLMPLHRQLDSIPIPSEFFTHTH